MKNNNIKSVKVNQNPVERVSLLERENRLLKQELLLYNKRETLIGRLYDISVTGSFEWDSITDKIYCSCSILMDDERVDTRNINARLSDLVSEYIFPEDQAKVIQGFKLIIEKQEPSSILVRIINKERKIKWFRLEPEIVYESNGSGKLFGIFLDVTESEFYKKKEGSDPFLREIIQESKTGTGVINNHTILKVNSITSDITGFHISELLGNRIDMLFLSNLDFDRFKKKMNAQILEQGVATFRTVWKRKDQKLINVLLTFTPIKHKSITSDMIFTVLDITKAKQSIGDLQESQRMLLTLFHNLPGMAYRCKNDQYWTMLFISSGCNELTGYQVDDLINNNKITYADVIHPDDREYVVNDVSIALSTGKQFELEYRILTAKNKVKYVLERGVGIFGENNELLFIEGFISDITTKKSAEEIVKKELKEKEILLKEIHHRVKNNLQIITSLLSIQASQSNDSVIQQAFLESKNRIYSMAIVHEKMYRSENFSKIDFKEYIESITQEIFYSYSVFDNVTFSVNVNNMYLELDKAISCGLIVNELITNTVKHAFPNNNKGCLSINAELEQDMCRLEVRDNGVGISNEIDFWKAESMGFMLIKVLTKQINGKLELKNDQPGVEFVINFSL